MLFISVTPDFIVTLFLLSVFIGSSECRRRWTNNYGHHRDGDGQVAFLLYNNNSDPKQFQELVRGDRGSISGSAFTPNILTILLTHGFGSGKDALSIAAATKAHLDAKAAGSFNANYIVVDWSALAGTASATQALSSYGTAVSNIPSVSVEIATFVADLVKWGMLRPSQTHLIGHSLGGQMMGRAGYNFQDITEGKYGKLARITALDPAGPCFGEGQPGRLLSKGDADFVDVLNTDWDYFGTNQTLGHLTFFVNNGRAAQPGCGTHWWNTWSTCSHIYAVWIYAQSVSKQYIGCQLPDGKTPPDLNGKIDGCDNPVSMGPYAPMMVRGVFQVDTTSFEIPPDHDEEESAIWSAIPCSGSSK